MKEGWGRRRTSSAAAVVAVVLILLLRPVDAQSASGFVELHVEPAVIDVADTPSPPKPHWRVLTTPRPVVHADEPFGSILQQSVDRTLSGGGPWIMDRGSSKSLMFVLERELKSPFALAFETSAFVDSPSSTKKLIWVLPPRPEAFAAHLFIRFSYVLPHIAKLRVEVRSSGVPPGAKKEDVATKDLPLPPDLRETLPVQDRDAVAGAITLQLWGAGKQFADREEERLTKVARLAFGVARDAGVLPARLMPSEQTQGLVVRQITSSLVPPPRVPAGVKPVTLRPDAGEPGAWVLTVHVAPISDVKIDASFDLSKLLAPGTTVDQTTRTRLAVAAALVGGEIKKRFETDFKALRGTVLTPAEVDSVRSRLRRDEAVQETGNPRLEGDVLIYPLIIRPTVQTLMGSGGIGYSPREGVTGTAGLSESNLLGIHEDASIDVTGGLQTWRGTFALGVPIPSNWWHDDRLAARVSLHGLSSLTDDTVLGQSSRATVTEEEHSVRLRHSLTFRPFAPRDANAPPDAPTATVARTPSTGLEVSKSTALSLDLAFGLRDVDLRGVETPVGVPIDGVVAPLGLTFRGTTGFTPREPTARVRQIDLLLESTLEHSFAVLGSDLRYDRWDIRAAIESLFWWFSSTPRNDILLRYVHGFGAATDGTPLFRFLRVGGEANVRGVEEGEFVGRRLHFQQVEAGLGLCSLQQVLFGNRHASGGAAADADAAGKIPAEARECQIGGLDFSQAFLKVFVDHAEAAERAVGRRLERATRSIFGTGVALELRDLPIGPNLRLALSIGYAYSPDSGRHSSGTVFTQVVVPFGLR